MLTRRDFLRQSLAVVSVGAAVPGVFGRAVIGAAEEESSASVQGKTLVVVQLAGGVDGLNTLVPFGDPAYRDHRPSLGIAEQDLLPIDGSFAFNRALAGVKELYDAGKVAVVQGVGYPKPNYSHFKAMDIWQSADPEGTARHGWLGRYFEGLTDIEGHPLAGLSVGRSLPSAFETAGVPVPAIEGVESYRLQAPAGDAGQRRTASLMRLYDAYRPSKTGLAALLDTSLDSAHKSSLDLGRAHAAYKPAVQYPQTSIASGLRLLAELIDAGEGEARLRVGHVTLGGFDTHANQPASLNRLLGDAGNALSAFWRDIEAHGKGDDVLVMTWSEFGRRPRQNGNNGTDHGSAGPMFLIGNKLKGGLHGEPPSLTQLDNGNLRFTTDFRSVYATVIERWLQAPSQDVLGARFELLPFLA
jgi:uncharacterized protein (DUF1501 family)